MKTHIFHSGKHGGYNSNKGFLRRKEKMRVSSTISVSISFFTVVHVEANFYRNCVKQVYTGCVSQILTKTLVQKGFDHRYVKIRSLTTTKENLTHGELVAFRIVFYRTVAVEKNGFL